jgi:hypothetical protein
MIAASLAATLGAGAACAAGWRTVVHDRRGETVITHQRGADGAIDSQRIGPRGAVSSVERVRGADGATSATRTGPAGRQWRVDRRRGADGAIDSVHTRPDGSTVLVDRQRP